MMDLIAYVSAKRNAVKGGWNGCSRRSAMNDKEKEMLIHALTIIKCCKEHKNCKGCMFWNNTTGCPFREKSPYKWRIYGFDSVLEAKDNDK
jgi:hypothetical protein